VVLTLKLIRDEANHITYLIILKHFSAQGVDYQILKKSRHKIKITKGVKLTLYLMKIHVQF